MTSDPTDLGSPTSSRVSDAHLATVVPKDRGGREVRVGAFVIIGILSFIMVLFLLTDPATLRGRYMLVTEMADAGGVRKGDPIQMRGVNIGRINKFEMDARGQVAVTMEIEGEWQIPLNSRAELGDAGLFGGRTVVILQDTVSTTFYQEWDTIPGQGERASVFETVDDLSQDAIGVLQQIESLVDSSMVADLKSSANELPEVLRTLRVAVDDQREELNRLTSSLTRSAENLETVSEASPDMASAIARADSLLAELESVSGKMNSVATSLDAILARMDAGEGTLGKLSRDDSLYVAVTSAADAFGQLMTAIRERPGDFVTFKLF